MELLEATLQKFIVPLTALLGAVIGGMFSLRASSKAYQLEMAKEQKRDEREVQNMLDAIGIEIGTLWNFHMQRIGAMAENLPIGGAFEFYYPLTQDYFTVYNTNAGKIGAVSDKALREAIVVCYNKCKKVVDGFKYNNVLYKDYRDLLMMPPTSQNHNEYVQAKHAELVEFATIIIEDHYEVKGYVEQLLALLDARS